VHRNKSQVGKVAIKKYLSSPEIQKQIEESEPVAFMM